VFQSAQALSSFAYCMQEITDPTMLKVAVRMLIDNGNPEGIPQHQNIAKTAMMEVSKMLFHRTPHVRTAVGTVIVSHEMKLPSTQQLSHPEIIRSGLLILKTHLFDHLEIKCGYSMLMAVLKAHRRIDSIDSIDNAIETTEHRLPLGCDSAQEVLQIRDGVLLLLNNPKPPNSRTMFESRDYGNNLLRSSQEAALKLIKHIAEDKKHGHVMDHKVVVREIIGSMTNKQDYVVQVAALEVLRVMLAQRERFPVSVGILSLLLSKKLFKKLNALHHFLSRGEHLSSSPTSPMVASTSPTSPGSATSPGSPGSPGLPIKTKKSLKRGKKNWLKAISSTTSAVESIGGEKILSVEAGIRHFLTTDLDADTMAGLHKGLRRMGWMDQSTGPKVNSTTSSLLLGNKLRSRILAKRKKKLAEKMAKEQAAGLMGTATSGSAVGSHQSHQQQKEQKEGKEQKEQKEQHHHQQLSPQQAIGHLPHGYHDEGVMHLPHEYKHKTKNRNHQRSMILRSRVVSTTSNNMGAGGQVRPQLKMAQLLQRSSKHKKSKKRFGGGVGSLVTSIVHTKQMEAMPSYSSSLPVASTTHLRYRPLGFASFADEGKTKEEEEEEEEEKLKKNTDAAEDMLENVTKDEHSFTQACANRNVITFNSRMSAGAERVLSIEAGEAAAVAAGLMEQIDIAEQREDSDAARVAVKMGSGISESRKTSMKYKKGTKMYSAQKVERAMELLSARNQRHKRPVRIQVTVSDNHGKNSKVKKSWGALTGHDTVDNPVARALLRDYCCGFNLEEQEKIKGKV
jgi:hypothetical protein